MKIVQSFWTKPARKDAGSNHCSWTDNRYNYFSWTLSVLQLRRFYPCVELYTDRQGYELLIEKLELPYTSVKVVLGDLDDYPTDLWAIGKVYTYSLQTEPFLHIDGDVFIWEPLRIDPAANLVAQNCEDDRYLGLTYAATFLPVMKHFDYYPAVLDRTIARNKHFKAVNAGVLGGCNIGFFKDFTRMAFEFVDRNLSRLSMVDAKMFNIHYEQFLFYALCEERGEKLDYLYRDDKWGDFSDYSGVPEKTKYIHTPGGRKREKYIRDCLEYRMLKDYPEHYYKILQKLRTHQI